MKMVGEEFLDRLEYYQSSWLPARATVEEAVKERHQVQDCNLMCIFMVLVLCPLETLLLWSSKKMFLKLPRLFVHHSPYFLKKYCKQ